MTLLWWQLSVWAYIWYLIAVLLCCGVSMRNVPCRLTQEHSVAEWRCSLGFEVKTSEGSASLGFEGFTLSPHPAHSLCFILVADHALSFLLCPTAATEAAFPRLAWTSPPLFCELPCYSALSPDAKVINAHALPGRRVQHSQALCATHGPSLSSLCASTFSRMIFS